MTAPRATRLLTLAVTLMVGGASCSSGELKDQFYGTDVGANWIPLDATPRDAPSDAAATDGGEDAGEAGATAADAGPSADSPAGDTLSD
jgi:hypothetical protein